MQVSIRLWPTERRAIQLWALEEDVTVQDVIVAALVAYGLDVKGAPGLSRSERRSQPNKARNNSGEQRRVSTGSIPAQNDAAALIHELTGLVRGLADACVFLQSGGKKQRCCGIGLSQRRN